MLRIISVALVLVAPTFLGRSSTAAQAGTAIDISRWNNNSNREWGFNISVPPDWGKFDMPPFQMTLAHQIDSDRLLMCVIVVRDQPMTAQMSQQQINAGVLRAGPPSPQAWESTISATGQPYRVFSTSLGKIMNLPVLVYEASLSSQSMDTYSYSRQLGAVLDIPGRTFAVNCTASAEAENGAQELYQHWLPTFRAIFSSFVVEPLLGR